MRRALGRPLLHLTKLLPSAANGGERPEQRWNPKVPASPSFPTRLRPHCLTTLLTTAALLLRCPPLLAQTRADGTRLTSFQASLAAFAGNTRSEPGSAEWNAAVAKALKKEREAIAASSGKKVKTPADHSEPRDDRLYGTDPSTARLSRRLSVAEFNAMAESAGIPHRCK